MKLVIIVTWMIDVQFLIGFLYFFEVQLLHPGFKNESEMLPRWLDPLSSAYRG